MLGARRAHIGSVTGLHVDSVQALVNVHIDLTKSRLAVSPEVTWWLR